MFFSDTSVPEENPNVEWSSLLRGAHTLLKAAGAWMTSSSMKLILRSRYIELEQARAADPEVSSKLTALSSLWDSSPGKFYVNDVEALNETLTLLHEAWGLVALSSIDHEIGMVLVVYAWPLKYLKLFLLWSKSKGQKPSL